MRSPSGTHSHPSSTSAAYRLSIHRDFSWGAKHKLGHKSAGKVWKGFSTQDSVRARRQLYRSILGSHRYTPHLGPYLPIQELRSLSSWGKPGGTWTQNDKVTTSKSASEEKNEEDWYSKYQLQKKKQYDDFMRRMEEDPVGMLFGSRWAKWVDNAEAKLSHASAPNAQDKSSSNKGEKTIWSWGCYEPSTSSQKSSKEEVKMSKQTSSHTVVVQSLNREYEIDPITNRRVQKMATTPQKSAKPEASTTEEPSPVAVSNVSDSADDSERTFKVPVKRFVPTDFRASLVDASKDVDASSRNREDSPSYRKSKATSGWLAKEGFGYKQADMSKTNNQPPQKIEVDNSKPAITRIESALDRHLQNKSPDVRDSVRAKLEYKPTENRTEDVDLLRPSDVKASAGLRGRPARESDVEKQARQRRLEEEYDSRPRRRDNQLAQEVAEQARQQTGAKKTEVEQRPTLGTPSTSKTSVADKEKSGTKEDAFVDSADRDSEPSATQSSVENSKQAVQTMISEKANKIKAQIIPLKIRLDAVRAKYDALRQRWLEEKRAQEEKASKRLRDMHEGEVNAQKVAMEAMESRRIAGITKCRPPESNGAVDDVLDKPTHRLESYLPGEGDMASNVHEFASRDRWYKKKAPHANDEMNAKLHRLANDRALIREVREIYEETYGTINATHSQSALSTGTQVPPATDLSSTLPEDARSSNLHISHAPSNTTSSSKQATDAIQDHLPAKADPLAVIQRLFDALRGAQSLVQDHRRNLQHLSNPSESQIQSIFESSETLAIIQKLFNELRQAQTLIQEQRANIKQTDCKESLTTFQGPEVHDQSVEGTAESGQKLASNDQALPNHTVSSVSPAPKATCASVSETKSSISLYRILAYDPAKQKVIASKNTSLAPFSEEQPLLLVDALGIVKNPGKFLPELMTLHNKGYTAVSGTSNTLVLKKLATPQEIEEARGKEILKDVNPIDLTGTEHYHSSATGPDFTSEEIKATPEKQGKAHQNPGSSSSDSSAPSASSSTEPASAESDTPSSATSASESNLPPSEKGRREEAVFSGPSRSYWQEAKSKTSAKRNKRAAKRSRKLKNMLVTGTVTAACCYAVGVISQML